VTSSPHQDRWIVHFEGIADRDVAERWRGVVLQAEPLADADDDVLWVHELVGATVTLADGTRTQVQGFLRPTAIIPPRIFRIGARLNF
jgi:ribosomal 30S subunit maturation factor RimM